MLAKLSLFLMRLFCIGIWLTAVGFFANALLCRRSIVAALSDFLFVALPLAAVSGLLFLRYFVFPWVDSIVEKIFWNSVHLKKTPLALTPFYGGLSNGAYFSVWQEMRDLPEEEFRDPEVVCLFAQACMNLPGQENEGVEAMETFFGRVRGNGHSADILTLLLYYADTALAFRTPGAVREVLEKALKKYRFAGHEEKAVRARVDALNKLEDV